MHRIVWLIVEFDIIVALEMCRYAIVASSREANKNQREMNRILLKIRMVGQTVLVRF